jgi:hypothetical protein
MINNSEFLLKEIPFFHPDLDEYEYVDFWRGVKSKIIQGEIIGGKFMPGPLWYGCNFHNIQLEDPMGNQYLGLMKVRDIDWELYYYYEEARGFSGFSNSKYSCHRDLGDPDVSDEDLLRRIDFMGKRNQLYYDNVFNKDGSRKIYKPAREVLRSLDASGIPLYFNNAKNVALLSSRMAGKSVFASVLANHNIITDGALYSDYYFEQKDLGQAFKSFTIVASQEGKYVNSIMKIIKEAYYNYPGKFITSNTTWESPLFKTPNPGADWGDSSKSTAGSVTFNGKDGTGIISRVVADNPLSVNSGRPNLSIIDEFGFVSTLTEVIGALEGSTAAKARKNNPIMMMGTGGLGSSGAIKYAERIFMNPDAYNCIAVDDIFENRGKIGIFIPITMASIAYKKGENLITDLDYAEKMQFAERVNKKKDAKAYQSYIINNPLFPSECFLLGDNSVYPTILLKDHLAQLEFGNKTDVLRDSAKGWFKELNGEIEFNEEPIMPIRDYPLNNSTDSNKKGAFEVWQWPQKDEYGVIKKGRYIASADIVANDVIGKSESLPSLLIFDRETRIIVAEYTGRTNDTKFFYTQARRALQYYNAVCMYEQNIKGMFTFFEQERCLHLLADRPHQMRNAEAPFVEGTNTSKGILMNKPNINTGVQYIQSWLESESLVNTQDLMLHHINSPAILKELISYDPSDGNYDRHSSLILLMWYDETLRVYQKKETSERRKTFYDNYLNARQKDLGKNNSPLKQISPLPTKD